MADMVRTLLKDGASFFSRQQTSILSAASILMGTSLIAALLGVVRWRLLFTYFGNSSDLGLFLLADRIPSFLFTLFVSGTFSSCFIPVFSRWYRQDQRTAWRLASVSFCLIGTLFTCVLLLTFAAARPISWYLSAGRLSAGELEHMVSLLRFMLLSQIFLVFSAFVSAIHYSLRHFLVPALAPIVYWLSSIVCLYFFAPTHGIYAAAYGMFLGSLLHLLVQLPQLHSAYAQLSLSFDTSTPGVRDLISLFIPRSFSLLAPELGSLLEGVLAASISIFSAALLTAAQTLYAFPLTLIAVPLAQAAFPFLVEKADGEESEFVTLFISTFRQILFFMTPVVFLLIVLRLPVVRLVFGSDEFRWSSTVLTGYTLAYLTLGLLPQALLHLIVRSFHALHDTKTPLFVGVVGVFTQVVLGIVGVFVFHWPVWCLGIASSVGVGLQFILLTVLLRRRLHNFRFRFIVLPTIRILSAGGVSAGLTYMVFKLLDRHSWGQGLSLGPLSLPNTLYNVIIDTSYTMNLVVFSSIISFFALSLYALLTFLMDIEEMHTLVRLCIRKFFPRYAHVSLSERPRQL